MPTATKVQGVAGTAPSCVIFRKDARGHEAELPDGKGAVHFDDLRSEPDYIEAQLNPTFADFILTEALVDPIATIVNLVYSLASDVEMGEMAGWNPGDLLRQTAKSLLLAADAR